MKKNKLLKLIKISGVIICTSFIFVSCDAGKDFTASNSKLKKNHSISFEQFKSETNQHDFKTKIKLKSNLNNLSARNADGTYELSDFEINTDLIKRLELNDKTTYSFRIYPTVVVTPSSFYNLNLYKKGDEWVQSVVEFKPSEDNLEKLLSGESEKLDGKMSVLYTSNLDSLRTNNVCYKVEIVNSHCNLQGLCSNDYCDGCYGSIGQGCIDKQYSSFCFNGNNITLGEEKDILNQNNDDNNNPNYVDVKNSYLLNTNEIKENAQILMTKNIEISNSISDLLKAENNLNFSNFPASISNMDELIVSLRNCGINNVDGLINLLKQNNQNNIDFNEKNRDFNKLKQATKDNILNKAFDISYNTYISNLNNSSYTNRGCYAQWVVDNRRCTRNFAIASVFAVGAAGLTGGVGGLLGGGYACAQLWFCKSDALDDYNACVGN